MISLLAVAKSSGECVCRFLAVNEQIQTLLNGHRREGGGYSHACSANNSILKTKDGGNSIIVGGVGGKHNGSLLAFLMACSFILKIVSLLKLCMLPSTPSGFGKAYIHTDV